MGVHGAHAAIAMGGRCSKGVQQGRSGHALCWSMEGSMEGLTLIQSHKETVALQGEAAAAYASYCTSP